MPYIATDLDAFDQAQGVAGATGIPIQQVLGGLALLWRWCWRQKTDRVTDALVSGHMGIAAPSLIPSLVAFGFLEDLREHGYRVRGTARYLHLFAVRSAAGKVRAANAKRGDKGRLEASTQPAPNQHVLDAPPAADQHPTSSGPALTATSDERMNSPTENPRAAHADGRPFRLEEQRQKRTRKPSRQEVLHAALVARRAEVLGPDALPDDAWSVQRQNEQLGGPILECAPDLLLAALERFLGSDFAGRCSPPGPLGVFVKQWSRWVDLEMKARAAGGAA